MGRIPKARQKVLDAAERVVRERGAAALTFDEVVAVSGVTRGGITYHFPTKDDLLRALVARDRERWEQSIAENRCAGGCPATGDLVAYIRSATERDIDHQRFVAGMLSAVAHDPALLDSCREFYRDQSGRAPWDELQLRRMLLRLAADGLFWMETFGFVDLPNPARKRLVLMMEAFASEWAPPMSARANASAGARSKPRPSGTPLSKASPSKPPRSKPPDSATPLRMSPRLKTKAAATGKGSKR
jgi:AcrR family transcriptional regulator